MMHNAEPFSSRGLLYRAVPSVCAAVLMGTALLIFFSTYGYGNPEDKLNTGLSVLFASSFYVTFAVFFGLAWLCIQIACLSNSNILNGFTLSSALLCYLFAVYSLSGSLSIKLCIAAALVSTAGLRVSPPANGILSLLFYVIIIRSLFNLSYAGQSLLLFTNAGLSFADICTFTVILFVLMASSVAVRWFAESSLHNRETIIHLNQSISQISKVNQELQDIARKAGEEGASIERNRISRDIHDISGYIFTNIISLMDAGMSTGLRSQEKIEEVFQSARTQAKEGLQETRKALHALRGGIYGGPRGLEAIYRIKQVFQDITGIDVTVDAGNIPNRFSDDIDRMIYRTVQETLTNAMRHGRATKVRISFHLDEGMLSLTVTDNGVGAKVIVRGIGLAGMEERIEPFGGKMVTSNPVEGGFRICITLPIPEKSAGEKENGNEAENQSTAGR